MSIAQAARQWTADEVRALPDDGNRYEVIDGELLVSAAPADGPPRAWSAIGPLLLAIEVLSPSTSRHDRFTKRRLYQREGVPEYWIVDADARLVERWRPADERPEMLDARMEWRPRDDVPPLVIDLDALFREVWGS